MFFLKKNLRYIHWQIAYRRKGEKVFKTVANPPFAWAADPFLVEYEGHIYLFAELFLYKSERNGVIGYCEYFGDSFGCWTISMDEHWHLSYPNVFVRDGKLMMCPETYQKKEVALYELKCFPDQWVQTQVLASNVQYVDTTLLTIEDSEYLFTFKPVFSGDEGSLLISKKTQEGNFDKYAVISNDKSVARPGGNFIKKGSNLYRVSQSCKNSYGEAVVISKVLSIEPEYREEIIKTISPKNVRIDTKKKVLGIHTYNRLNELEVIDFKYYEPSYVEAIAARRTKKVFTNKY